MLIKCFSSGFEHPVPSEITPLAAYQSRREMMRMLATGVAGVALAGWASREALAQPGSTLPGTNASLPQCQIHGEWGNG